MASSDARILDAMRALDHPGTRGGVVTPLDQLTARPRISLRGHEDFVSLTMEFRCNLACVHCMIEGTMDHLQPTSDEMFDKVCRDQTETGRWKGLVLTGSEITLRRDLPNLAEKARAAGFLHVRIQTHGMHLARADYVRRLIDAGVDEYFVSVAGNDAESHDRITRVPGSWDKMMMGLAHLDQYPHVSILTNSVVTTQSFALLPGMVSALSGLRRLRQMEFWNYFPMAEADDKGLLASNSDILPYLVQAIRDAGALGRFVEVKNFPECMLGQLGDALVNAQPMLVIDPAFWAEFDRNGFHNCPHRTLCASTECLGLSRAYLRKFGDDATVLRPLRALQR